MQDILRPDQRGFSYKNIDNHRSLQLKKKPIDTAFNRVMLDGMSRPPRKFITLNPSLTCPILKKDEAAANSISSTTLINLANQQTTKLPAKSCKSRATASRQMANLILAKPDYSSVIAEHKAKKTKRFMNWRSRINNYSKPQIAMMAAGCLVFLVGLAASIVSFQTNGHVTAQIDDINKSSDNSDNNGYPDESDPDPNASYNYSVAPDMPKRISINKINVYARILPLGIKADGSMDAPYNIYDTGWYDKSSKPGESGAMLIDGHVSGLTRNGVFYDLKNLVVGDVIEVERGDGKIFKYNVVKSKSFGRQNVDMDSAVRPVEPGTPGLNIITCSGAPDSANRTYTERLIVYASLAE